MTRGIRAEMMKLWSVRATWAIVLGAVVLNVIAFLAPGENVANELVKPIHEQQSTFFIAFLMRVVLVVLGVRSITDEWRHGTLTASLLACPGRAAFVVRKASAVSIFGLGVAVLATGVMLAAARGMSAIAGVALGPIDATPLVGSVVAGPLWAAIGVALGAIVRSQLLATVSGLVWLMAIDDMLRDRLGDLARYLPGQAGLGLAIAPTPGVLARCFLTLLAYSLLGLTAGIVLTRRRDVI